MMVALEVKVYNQEILRLCFLINFFQHDSRFQRKNIYYKGLNLARFTNQGGDVGCVGMFVRVVRGCMDEYK